MINFSANTDGQKRIQLEITVKPLVNQKMMISFMGYDSAMPINKYFDKTCEIPPQGRKIYMPMPVSPKQLNVCVWNYGNKGINLFKIEKSEIKPLILQENFWFKPELQKLFRFYEDFAVQLPNLKPGSYENNIVLIQGKFPENKITPMRFNHDTKKTEVSKELSVKYPVPMRVFLLNHEKGHEFYEPGAEEEADRFAIIYYLYNGWPATEAMYAFTKMFPETEQNKRRVNLVKDFVSDFQTKHGILV